MSSAPYRFGEFELNSSRFELRRNGRVVKLERIPLELLILLTEKEGNIVTRREIVERLWGKDVFVDTEHGINTAVRKIRQALRDDPERPRFVHTVTGKGYRFIAPEIRAESPNGNEITQLASVAVQKPAGSAGPIMVKPASELSFAKPNGEPAISARLASRSLILGVICFAALAIMGVAWLLRPELPAPRATVVAQLTNDGLPKWGPIASDGLRVYFTEQLNGHSFISAVPVTGGLSARIPTPFRDAAVLAISPSHTDLLVAEGHLIEEAPLWRLPLLGGAPRRLGNAVGHHGTWSPDGSRLAYVNGSALYVANADGSDSRQLLPPNPDPVVWAWSPTWSPDGASMRLEYYQMGPHGSRIWQVNLDGNNLYPMLAPSASFTMQACGTWAPDGNYFVFSAWRDLDSGVPWPAANLWAAYEGRSLLRKPLREPAPLTTGPVHFFDHTFSPDGKTLFATSSEKHGELVRFDAKTREFLPYQAGLSAEGVSFSPDGNWIAYVTYPSGELWRSRVDGTQPHQLTHRPLFALEPKWSPDGRHIAFSGQRAGEWWQLYVVSADGDDLREIHVSGGAMDESWSPDGKSLMFGVPGPSKAGIRTVDLQTGKMQVIPGSENLFTPQWSPDGRYIAATTADAKGLQLFDFRTKTWREPARGGDVSWPLWSPDGKYIYFARMDYAPAVFRLPVRGSKPETVVSLKDFRSTGAAPGWFAITPANELLMLRNTGNGMEIYALSWDAP